MNSAMRITSETFVLTLLLLAVPTLLTAQRLGAGPGQIPTSPVAPSGPLGIAMLGIILAIVGLVGIAVILSDIARRHEEQGLLPLRSAPVYVGQTHRLLDHVIRPLQKGRWDRQAGRLRHGVRSDQIVVVNYASCGL